jgi:hypothetical protein
MPPKKKVLATATQPHKMADKVKPETMTDEAWAHEQARCQYVIEDRNRAECSTSGKFGHHICHTVCC